MDQVGRYTFRIAACAEEVAEAQALRHRCFPLPDGAAPWPDGREADAFDRLCQHGLVRDQDSGRLVACFRLLLLNDGAEIGRSYSAQFYDLRRLEIFAGPIAELGRFCIDPDVKDPDVLRLVWAALTQIVDERRVGLLFGCASFSGYSPAPYRSAFRLLTQKSLAPLRWRPRQRAKEILGLAREAKAASFDPRLGLMQLPPLLRSYLAMGGWVSDHAVIDRSLGTLHVFTGLEIARIPPARKRLLRALASPGLAVLKAAQ
jgi:putative hemolysin